MPTILVAARANALLAPLGACVALGAAVVVARVLQPEAYADYATLMALLTWLLLLAEAGCNIGLARYLRDAGTLRARLTLYWTLQRRRWLFVLGVTAVVCFAGPLWASAAGLDPDRWRAASFLLVGILAGVMLHGQLAGSALATEFQHKRLLWLAQLMTILRAACLAALATLLREPIALVGALLLVALVESLLLHRAARKLFPAENESLPAGLATAAQSHGLASLFNKLSTALASGPFLLLILAGAHSRTDLALLAIATDLLQRALSVVGLPIAGLVLPLLHESRGDEVRFRLQLERLGGLVVAWFSISMAAVAALLPIGLPLLLGDQYSGAVSVALVWLLPLFVESAVRMVWGAALLTLHQYRWFAVHNCVFSLVVLAVVCLARDQKLLVLLVCLGVVKFMMSIAIIVQAHRKGLAPAASRPFGIVLAAVACCLMSLIVQFYTDGLPDAIRVTLGGVVYALAMLASLKSFPLIPAPAYQALCSLAGRHAVVVKKVLVEPSEGRGRA